ncbi:exodeoxyribonuclease III [Poseidonocella sp. HB161398]|uniref:exodeoxyribonuclease III n=1 Tax=Poseidonocella sp. HB161398 TaxID=2320855 RepID=UPI0011084815|nr:exodeoxyribonuclease III [Poseidonocella sp. HB161398]
MSIKIATWNINSVRLRQGLVQRLLSEHAPDVLCLQECKCPEDKFPYEAFAEMGWSHAAVRGEKGYNGVAILSRLPLEPVPHRDVLDRGDTRHVAAKLPNGVTIHNFYIPAGGDVPDREVNEKFGHKLDFLSDLTAWFVDHKPQKSILVGDLNIAPREDDVWSHKQLLKIVSHTPVETSMLADLMAAGDWVDVTRQDIPEGKLYSWWSYRARDWSAADKGRRLDHVWATADLAPAMGGSEVLREARGWEQPSDHAPVFARIDG